MQLQAHTTLRLRASLSKAREETGKVKSPVPVPRPVHTTQLSYSETGRPRPTGFRFRPAGRTSHRNRLGSEDGRGRESAIDLSLGVALHPPAMAAVALALALARPHRTGGSLFHFVPSMAPAPQHKHRQAKQLLCARRNRPTLSGVRTAQITRARARSYY